MAENQHVVFNSSVRDILEEFKKGHRVQYDRLKIRLVSPEIKSQTLLDLLHQLQAAVSLLTDDCQCLVKAILKVPWLQRSEDIHQAYVHLMVNLASAKPIYVLLILQRLITLFSPQDNLDTAVLATGESNSSLELCYATVHGLIQSLVHIIPTLPRHFLACVRDNFPSISSDREVQEAFIKNLLHVCNYLPDLRQEILEMIIHRLTDLDVHCPKDRIWETEDTSDEDSCDETEEMQFNMDDVNNKTIEKKPPIDEDSAKKGERSLTEVASVLDCLMYSLLTYCKGTCYQKGELHIDKAEILLRQLFQAFVKIVLPTHCSSHVQFFIFYICSMRKSFGEAFLESLWQKFVDPNISPVIRQVSATYIASFLARSNYISLGIITACLELMGKWIHSYIENQELNSNVNLDVIVHGPFYSLCQAAFYIIIYRCKELLGSEKGMRFVMSLNLDRIISCKLNPLRVCLPAIVNIFATITRKYQVAFCYTIMERNARNLTVLPDTNSGYSSQKDHNNQLSTFFPFDPYVLPKSKLFFSTLYKQWDSTIIDSMQKPVRDEDEFKIYEDQLLEEVTLDLMPSSLSAISPGFMSV